jgi:cell fate (sporulation/competence/biofilm development) regulator YlbF (YheA/YmcA/DUF963 family)
VISLCDEIKQDKRYLEFKKASEALNNKEIQNLLQRYQEAISNLNSQQQYSKYIDISEAKNKLKDVKEEVSKNKIIQNYYHTYYELNNYLDEILDVILKDVDTGRGNI